MLRAVIYSVRHGASVNFSWYAPKSYWPRQSHYECIYRWPCPHRISLLVCFWLLSEKCLLNSVELSGYKFIIQSFFVFLAKYIWNANCFRRKYTEFVLRLATFKSIVIYSRSFKLYANEHQIFFAEISFHVQATRKFFYYVLGKPYKRKMILFLFYWIQTITAKYSSSGWHKNSNIYNEITDN